MNKKNIKRGLLPYVFLVLLILGIYYVFNVVNEKVNPFTYDQFISELNKGNIEEVTIVPRERAMVYEISGKLKGYSEKEKFYVKAPLSDEVIKKIINSNEDLGFTVEAVSDPESSSLLYIVINVLPMVILIGGAFFIFSKQMGSAGKSMDFGKSKARLNDEKNKVTFKDVSG